MHCLGCGGFASTLDCIKADGPFDRIPVAIKQAALDRRAAERFEATELRGLATMSGRTHPNIVRYLGFFKGDEGAGKTRLSFIFERCPLAVPYLIECTTTDKGFVVPDDGKLQQPHNVGCDLCNNPVRSAPMTAREARYIVRQLLSAVAHLHEQKPPILHRDVKPDNALVWGIDSVDADTGESMLHVKLTDYGTMRRYDTRDLTMGQGTKAFMAPEVEVQTGTGSMGMSTTGAAGGGSSGRSGGFGGAPQPQPPTPTATYDLSADVFSVGATFYYLVTGLAPDGNTRLDWRERFGGLIIWKEDSTPSAVTDKVARRWADGGQAQQPAAAALPATGAIDAAAAHTAIGAAPDGSGRDERKHAENISVFESARNVVAAVQSQRHIAPAASTPGTDAPAPISLFSHFFPRGSHARTFLEGLVHKARDVGPSAPAATAAAAAAGDARSTPRRWTALEALKYLSDVWTDDVARMESVLAGIHVKA